MHFDQLKRCEFITRLGGAAAVGPLAVRAQQAMPVMGYISSLTQAPRSSEMGYVEGQNVRIEYRWMTDRYSLLSAAWTYGHVGERGQYLYVTSGIGTSGVPSRLIPESCASTLDLAELAPPEGSKVISLRR